MDVAGIIAIIGAVAGGIVLVINEVRKVHKIVNQQRTDMMAEIEALKKIIAVERRAAKPWWRG